QQTWSRSSIAGVMLAASQLFISACGGGGSDSTVTTQVSQGGQTNPGPVANSAPNLDITSPSSGANFSDGQEIAFTATADDNEDGNLSQNVQWSSNLDGALGTGAELTAVLSAGSHTITATVTDSGGEETSQSISVSVNEAANTVPQISITAPVGGSSFSDGQSITFTATADDNEDGDLSTNIEWSSNLDGALGTGSSFSTVLSVGSHTITATITDSEGEEVSEIIIVSVNETINIAPEISITAPVGGNSFYDSDVITFTASATDSEDGDISQNVIWYSDIEGEIGNGASINVSLSASTHTITAEITDSEGTTTQTQIDILVSATHGTATLSWAAPTAYTDDSELDDLAGYKIYYGENADDLDQLITIEDPNNLTHVFEELRTGTTYYFAVSAYNSTGVESRLSELVNKDT
ncbi:MAG: Ig-like domain-containing protein, partial [Kangiellaceae bacterium]|nr:Ig-like domain-containing protein [Kangiellaceae bacterium]